MITTPFSGFAAIGPRSFGGSTAPAGGPFVEPGFGTRQVLVVEDDGDLRETLVSLIEDEGFDAIGAENGDAAFGLLDAGLAPDLILLDLGMPVMDGWTFMARLREMPGVGATPVAVMSAGRNLARAPVSAAYLEKPVRREELLEVIGRLAAP